MEEPDLGPGDLRFGAPARPMLPDHHSWAHDVCVLCGLRRREEWVRDLQLRLTTALVWRDQQDRAVAVHVFPPVAGLDPGDSVQSPPSLLSSRFAGAAAAEPSCRGLI